jgi:hypothetical protein
MTNIFDAPVPHRPQKRPRFAPWVTDFEKNFISLEYLFKNFEEKKVTTEATELVEDFNRRVKKLAFKEGVVQQDFLTRLSKSENFSFEIMVLERLPFVEQSKYISTYYGIDTSPDTSAGTVWTLLHPIGHELRKMLEMFDCENIDVGRDESDEEPRDNDLLDRHCASDNRLKKIVIADEKNLNLRVFASWEGFSRSRNATRKNASKDVFLLNRILKFMLEKPDINEDDMPKGLLDYGVRSIFSCPNPFSNSTQQTNFCKEFIENVFNVVNKMKLQPSTDMMEVEPTLHHDQNNLILYYMKAFGVEIPYSYSLHQSNSRDAQRFLQKESDYNSSYNLSNTWTVLVTTCIFANSEILQEFLNKGISAQDLIESDAPFAACEYNDKLVLDTLLNHKDSKGNTIILALPPSNKSHYALFYCAVKNVHHGAELIRILSGHFKCTIYDLITIQAFDDACSTLKDGNVLKTLFNLFPSKAEITQGDSKADFTQRDFKEDFNQDDLQRLMVKLFQNENDQAITEMIEELKSIGELSKNKLVFKDRQLIYALDKFLADDRKSMLETRINILLKEKIISLKDVSILLPDACELGASECVGFLLDKMVVQEKIADNVCKALLTACFFQKTLCVKKLLESKKVSKEFVFENIFMALKCTLRNINITEKKDEDSVPVLQELIKYASTKNAWDNPDELLATVTRDNFYLLQFACRHDARLCVTELLQIPNLSVDHFFNNTKFCADPIAVACVLHETIILKELLEFKGSDEKAIQPAQLMHTCTAENQSDLVKSIDIYETVEAGETVGAGEKYFLALEVACIHENSNALDILLKIPGLMFGDLIHANFRALRRAAQRNDFKCVEKLLNFKGIEENHIEMTGTNEKTAYDLTTNSHIKKLISRHNPRRSPRTRDDTLVEDSSQDRDKLQKTR